MKGGGNRPAPTLKPTRSDACTAPPRAGPFPLAVPSASCVQSEPDSRPEEDFLRQSVLTAILLSWTRVVTALGGGPRKALPLRRATVWLHGILSRFGVWTSRARNHFRIAYHVRRHPGGDCRERVAMEGTAAVTSLWLGSATPCRNDGACVFRVDCFLAG